MKSFVSLASVSLALLSIVDARIAPAHRRETEALPHPEEGLKEKLLSIVDSVLHPARLFNRQNQCVQDDVYIILISVPSITPFCAEYLNIPPVTAFSTVATTTTTTDDYSTRTITQFNNVQATPFSTVTVFTTTTGAPVFPDKRDAQAGVLHHIRQAASSPIAQDRITSFCNLCVSNALYTVTSPTTASTVTQTISAFDVVTATQDVTSFAPTQVTTVTAVVTERNSISGSAVVAAIDSEAAGTNIVASTTIPAAVGDSVVPPATITAVTSDPTPTSSTFSCPADENTNVTQVIGSRVFTYGISCGSALLDDNIADKTYNSLTDCVSACSIANDGLNSAVCQGITFIGTTDGSYNCFIKRSDNIKVASPGSTAVSLLAVGTTDEEAESGSSFQSSTTLTNAASASSDVATILTGDSGTIPIITPTPTPIASSASDSGFVIVSSTASSSAFTSSADGSVVEGSTTSSSVVWESSSVATTTISTSVASTAAAPTSDPTLTNDGSGFGLTVGNSTIGADQNYSFVNKTVVTTADGYQNVTEDLTAVYPNGSIFAVHYERVVGSAPMAATVNRGNNVNQSISGITIVININNINDASGNDNISGGGATTTIYYSSTSINGGSVSTSSSATVTTSTSSPIVTTSTSSSVSTTATPGGGNLTVTSTASSTTTTTVTAPFGNGTTTTPTFFPTGTAPTNTPSTPTDGGRTFTGFTHNFTFTGTGTSPHTRHSFTPTISFNSTFTPGPTAPFSVTNSSSPTDSPSSGFIPSNTMNSTMIFPTAPSSTSSSACFTTTVSVGSVTVTQTVTATVTKSRTPWSHHGQNNRRYWGEEQD